MTDVRPPVEEATSASPTSSVRERTARRRRQAILLVLGVATVMWVKPMGLLLWARLRILTSIPRTAVAEPAPDSRESAAPGTPSRPILVDDDEDRGALEHDDPDHAEPDSSERGPAHSTAAGWHAPPVAGR